MGDWHGSKLAHWAAMKALAGHTIGALMNLRCDVCERIVVSRSRGLMNICLKLTALS